MPMIHISAVLPGDTVIHNGHARTVCSSDLRHNDFMGLMLFGDSYALGTRLVNVCDKAVRGYEVVEIVPSGETVSRGKFPLAAHYSALELCRSLDESFGHLNHSFEIKPLIAS